MDNANILTAAIERVENAGSFGGFPGTDKSKQGIRNEIKNVQKWLTQILEEEKKPKLNITDKELIELTNKINDLGSFLRSIL